VRKTYGDIGCFFANNKTDEFSLCSAEIMSKPFFIDTIKLDNLSAEIYYKIVALDQRGNISPFFRDFNDYKAGHYSSGTGIYQSNKTI
jgi:hypothetical protein